VKRTNPNLVYQMDEVERDFEDDPGEDVEEDAADTDES
jgi:hypothetical protein